MFDISANLLIDLVRTIPYFVPIILVFNIISDLLWGGK